MQKQNLSSVECCPKHVSLTHFLRRNWSRSPNGLKMTLSKCSVSPYLGELPPELRAQVGYENLAQVTYNFRMALEDFIIANIDEMRDSLDVLYYDVSLISALFGTPCKLEFGAVNYAGGRGNGQVRLGSLVRCLSRR